MDLIMTDSEKIDFLLGILKQSQLVLTEYLKPDSPYVTPDSVIDDLLDVLDNSEKVKIQFKIEKEQLK